MENKNDNGKDNRKKNNKNVIIISVITTLLLFLLFTYMQSIINASTYKEKSYKEFVQLLDERVVSKVEVQADKVEFKLKG